MESAGERSPDRVQQGGDHNFLVKAPELSMPKGGGAIRGIGEKFAANPITGSSTFSIPLPVSPGRGGFAPQLALSYDSGSGNGPFGFGWSLALPAITRKTDRGLPRYRRPHRHLPDFGCRGSGSRARCGRRDRRRSHFGAGYVIRRYRPRIEGLFAGSSGGLTEAATRTGDRSHPTTSSASTERTHRIPDP